MSSNHKTRFALVGLGRQAERIAAAIALSKNDFLAAVLGEDGGHALDFAKRHGGPKNFTSLAALLRDDKKSSRFDVAFITSPNYRHAKEAIAFLKAGKYIISEKPLATTLRDGVAIVRAARQTGARGIVDFQLRHHPAVLEAKKLITEGVLGDTRFVELHWSIGTLGQGKLPALNRHMKWREDPKLSGGGAVMARGVHLFDLAQFITGKTIVGVRAYTDEKMGTRVDRDAVGILELEGGAFVSVITSKRIPEADNRITFYGENGRIKLGDVFLENAPSVLELKTKKGTRIQKFPPVNLYRELIEDFKKVRRGKQTASATLAEGAQVIAVTEAFLASARTGKALPVAQFKL